MKYLSFPIKPLHLLAYYVQLSPNHPHPSSIHQSTALASSLLFSDHVLVCVVARIDRLMPKRKFPEFCKGLPKQAGIKIVCACKTVLVATGGGGWLHFGKRETKREGHGLSDWFSPIPGHYFESHLKYGTRCPAVKVTSQKKAVI